MVFEDLIKPTNAKRHPYKLFFFGIIMALIAILISLWIFKEQASLVMVFLVVIMAMPLMYFTLKEEEEEDWLFDTELKILKEHAKAIKFLLFMFLGFIVGFLLVYITLPSDMINQIFSSQISTIAQINNNVSGASVNLSAFTIILLNNIKVMFFSLLFAIFFGAGALFILTWNASVISVAAGSYIRNSLSKYALVVGMSKTAIYFHLFVVGILKYMVHGIFEIAAYFIAALAGGIISTAVVNHSFREKGFDKITFDVSILIIISLGLLVIGALVEVFITPTIFG